MESPKTLTNEDIEKLLYELYWHPHTHKPPRKAIRNYTIALLMLDAGLRVGEVVHLQGFDLYFNSEPVGSIIVRPEIAKNKTERTIPVSQRLTAALKAHQPSIETSFVKFDLAYVFGRNWNRHPITTRQVERIIRLAAVKSLGRPVHPHVLRHTFASRLMRKTNIRVVQELLGHKHLTSTQVYTHPNTEDMRQAINAMDNVRSTLTGQSDSEISAASVPEQLNTSGTDGHVR